MMRLVYISSAAVSFVGAPAADGKASIKHHFVADAKLTPVSLADVMAKEVMEDLKKNNSYMAALKALDRSEEITREVNCFDDPDCLDLTQKVAGIRQELLGMLDKHNNTYSKTLELLANVTQLAKADKRLHDKKFPRYTLADTKEEEEKVIEDLYS